jgi:triphosphatase
LRVALRRLRAAISLFGTILQDASTEKVKTELKWLTSELAPAREIDVFVKEKIEPLGRSTGPKRGIRAIERQFSARRREAFQHARKALATQRYRELPIDVLEWLETRKRHNGEEADKIGKFAERVMHRRIKKVRKQRRDFAELSAVRRHKLRTRLRRSVMPSTSSAACTRTR